MYPQTRLLRFLGMEFHSEDSDIGGHDRFSYSQDEFSIRDRKVNLTRSTFTDSLRYDSDVFNSREYQEYTLLGGFSVSHGSYLFHINPSISLSEGINIQGIRNIDFSGEYIRSG